MAHLDGLEDPNPLHFPDDTYSSQQGLLTGSQRPLKTLCCDRNLYNILMTAMSFLLVFTAFNTTQIFAVKLLPGNLGAVSLGVLYLVFSCSNFFAPILTRKLGPRLAMLCGALAYCSYIGSLTYIVTPVVIFCSALIGIGASVLWTAQGVFLTQCSNETNRGLYSGIFWGIFQCSILPGNIASYFILKNSGSRAKDLPMIVGWDTVNSPLFFILTVSCVAGALLFLTLRAPDDSTGSKGFEHLVPPDGCKSVAGTFRLLFTKRMLMFTPLMFYTGLGMTYWAGWFTRQILDTRYIGVCMCGFGIAEAIGGLVLGRLSDRLGRTSVVMFGFFAQATAMYLSWLANERMLGGGDMLFFYIAAPILGLADCAFQTQLMAALASDYTTLSADAFAIFKLLQSLGAALGFGITGLFGGDTASRTGFLEELIILGGLLVLGIFFYLLMLRVPKEPVRLASRRESRR